MPDLFLFEIMYIWTSNIGMELYFGYFGALFIGLILGLTGSGGSILAVPILVYLMHLNPVTAAAYSLFVVGTTSAFGTVQNFRKGIVELKTALYFAVPSFIAVFLTRKFLVPALPEILFQNQDFSLNKDLFLMVLFAILMLFAAISMLTDTNDKPSTTKFHPLIIMFSIMSVGVLIGLVGAGGGFLIVPALFFMGKLPIRKAIGSSLLIITLNSLIGFTGDIGNMSIDWRFLFGFTAIAVAGIFAGQYCAKFVNERQLKKGFGWFVLLMAIVILIREIFFS